MRVGVYFLSTGWHPLNQRNSIHTAGPGLRRSWLSAGKDAKGLTALESSTGPIGDFRSGLEIFMSCRSSVEIRWLAGRRFFALRFQALLFWFFIFFLCFLSRFSFLFLSFDIILDVQMISSTSRCSNCYYKGSAENYRNFILEDTGLDQRC